MPNIEFSIVLKFKNILLLGNRLDNIFIILKMPILASWPKH
jgi:hypothetical protein